MGKGVSPVLATAILAGVVIAMAGGVYTFLMQNQQVILDRARQPELETVNLTCEEDRVVWWINNTGDVPVDGSEADVFFYTRQGIDQALSRTGIILPQGIRRAHGLGRLESSPGGTLSKGRKYTLEVSASEVSLMSNCRVGSEWWNINWEYRRAVKTEGYTPPVTVNVSFHVENLVDNGKMRRDCDDIRMVQGVQVIPYNVTYCGSNGNATVLANLSQVSGVYVYYGNLQAGENETTLDRNTMVEPGLGVEEELRLN
ncbi:MAG: hypothetical protein ABEI07_00605 [Candidatus Nanohaloarchaea archaeon]